MGGPWTVGKQADGGWQRMLSGMVVDGEVGGWQMVDDGKQVDGGRPTMASEQTVNSSADPVC